MDQFITIYLENVDDKVRLSCLYYKCIKTKLM